MPQKIYDSRKVAKMGLGIPISQSELVNMKPGPNGFSETITKTKVTSSTRKKSKKPMQCKIYGENVERKYVTHANIT